MSQGSLTSSDYKKLLEIIHLAHSIDNRDEMWRVVRERLEQLIGFRGALLLSSDAATRRCVLKDPPPCQSLKKERKCNSVERHRTILHLLLPHLSNASHHLYLREALSQALDNGVIALRGDGDVRLMNEIARRALNGRPVHSIPGSYHGEATALLQTRAGRYRVHSTTVRWGGKDKILLLEPLPSERTIGDKLDGFGLTQREREIAALVMRGFGNRAIAERLFIAEQTVKDHVQDIFGKMKIRRRSQLAAKLLEPAPCCET